LTEEQQDGAVQAEANAATVDQTPDRAATATAVADEPTTTLSDDTTNETGSADVLDQGPAVDAPGDATTAGPTTAPDANGASPVAGDSTDASSPGNVASEAVAPPGSDPETSEAPASAAAAQPSGSDAPGTTDAVSSSAAGTDSALSADDTADAPAAVEDEPEEVPAPRDLGPEPTTMEELLAEQDSDIKSFKHGDVVEGTVVRIDKDEILVDIGAKSEGVVSNRELYGRNAESQPQLTIGDTVLVYVLQPESQEGHAVLSLRRAGLERKWRAMQEQFEAGVIIEAPVIDHNKGGLIVDCGIRGFVPISQIVDFPRRPQNDQPRDAAQEIAEKLQPFVGRKLRLKILEVNRKANRLILSEKVALYEERREKRDELFSSLQVGQKVTGTVRSIAPFGVFIDLGGIDGLVHKSELSWNKVNNPESGYKVGDEVEAEVIDINHERGRISLSIRRLQPDPWHSTVADFNVGDVIDGTVTKLVNFGAFVRVRDGLEGLIHISELSHQRVAHPGDVVHEGQTLKLKIISLDSERHRLGLSLKQAEEPPARPAPEPVSAGGGGGGGGGAPSSAPRGERRPRPERGWSAQDAVQEPEGGIDNTLAAAFAQVRDQLAASEGVGTDAAASGDTDSAAEDAPAEAPAAEAPAAEAPATEPGAVEAASAETAADSTPDDASATGDIEAAVDAQETSSDVTEPAPVEAELPSVDAEAPAPEPVEAETTPATAPATDDASGDGSRFEASVAEPEAPTTQDVEPGAGDQATVAADEAATGAAGEAESTAAAADGQADAETDPAAETESGSDPSEDDSRPA
jgi:small subunit ribosomal protein S1